jgi:hypothetical protein
MPNSTARLRIENFGPIVEAEVEFGDLTVFVGPQATGKSLFLQVFKKRQLTTPSCRFPLRAGGTKGLGSPREAGGTYGGGSCEL